MIRDSQYGVATEKNPPTKISFKSFPKLFRSGKKNLSRPILKEGSIKGGVKPFTKEPTPIIPPPPAAGYCSASRPLKEGYHPLPGGARPSPPPPPPAEARRKGNLIKKYLILLARELFVRDTKLSQETFEALIQECINNPNHKGDCTGVSGSCTICTILGYLEQAKEIIEEYNFEYNRKLFATIATANKNYEHPTDKNRKITFEV